MSETTTAPPKVYEPVAWLSMTPLFVADEGDDVDEAIKSIRDTGVYSVFYILGEMHNSETVKNQNNVTTTVVTQHPRLFKVVNNLVGNAVSVVDNTSVAGLKEIEQLARFTLPRIPYDLILEIDAFFRAMHEKHGTEAIILFTYDEAYRDTENPEDGWGVVVPDQKNTAGSCDYDPTSVVDKLPDDPHEVSVVGSAHSHPEMSAYCSGTDKADQASFDGIHITFGWSKNSYTTNWHIELQMGGAAYTMTPEMAYDGLPQPKQTDRIEEWGKSVSKKYGGGNAGNPTLGNSTSSGGSTYTGSKPKYDHLPKELPEPGSKNAIVAMPLLTDQELNDCPVCLQKMIQQSKDNGKCTMCASYIVTMTTETVENLLKKRDQKNLASPELDFGDTDQYKSVWLWEERVDDHGKPQDEITLVREGEALREGGDSGKADGLYGDNTVGATRECPACYDDVSTDEIVCHSCGIELDDTVATSIQCPNCFYKIDPHENDGQCARCEYDLTANDLMGQVNRMLSPNGGQRPIPSSRLAAKARLMMLCCDETPSQCECGPDRQLSFLDADGLLEQMHDIEPYDPDAGCLTCALRFSAKCDPYVEMLKVLGFGGFEELVNATGEIDPCNEYIYDDFSESR